MNNMQLKLNIVPPQHDQGLGDLLQSFRQYARAYRVRIAGHYYDVAYGEQSVAAAGQLADAEKKAKRCAVWHAIASDISDRRDIYPLYAEWMTRLSSAHYYLIAEAPSGDNEELLSLLQRNLGLTSQVIEAKVDIPPESELAKRPPIAVRQFMKWAETASRRFHCVLFPEDKLMDVLGAVLLGRDEDIVITDASSSSMSARIKQIVDFATDAATVPEVIPAMDYLLGGGMIAKLLVEAGRLVVGLSSEASKRLESRLCAPVEAK